MATFLSVASYPFTLRITSPTRNPCRARMVSAAIHGVACGSSRGNVLSNLAPRLLEADAILFDLGNEDAHTVRVVADSNGKLQTLLPPNPQEVGGRLCGGHILHPWCETASNRRRATTSPKTSPKHDFWPTESSVPGPTRVHVVAVPKPLPPGAAGSLRPGAGPSGSAATVEGPVRPAQGKPLRKPHETHDLTNM